MSFVSKLILLFVLMGSGFSCSVFSMEEKGSCTLIPEPGEVKEITEKASLFSLPDEVIFYFLSILVNHFKNPREVCKALSALACTSKNMNWLVKKFFDTSKINEEAIWKLFKQTGYLFDIDDQSIYGDRRTWLGEAVREGRLLTTQRLLELGANPLRADRILNTPLAYAFAACNGIFGKMTKQNKEIFDMLKKHLANIKKVASEEEKKLHSTTNDITLEIMDNNLSEEHIKIIENFRANQFLVSADDFFPGYPLGSLPLLASFEDEKTLQVFSILSDIVDKRWGSRNISDLYSLIASYNFMTEKAIKHDHAPLLNSLIPRLNQAVEHLGKGVTIPLEITTMSGIKYIEYAVDKEAIKVLDNTDLSLLNANYSSENKSNYSPLFRAIANNNVRVVKHLLCRGVDINQEVKIVRSKDVFETCTPLTYSLHSKKYEIAKWLLRFQADTSAKLKRYTNDICTISVSAIHLAVQSGDRELIELILASDNKNIDYTSVCSDDSLWNCSIFISVAEFIDNKDLAEFIIKSLVDKKVDLNQKIKEMTSSGEVEYKNSLFYALVSNNVQIAKLFLKYGADPYLNCQEIYKDDQLVEYTSLLMLALESNDKELIQMILNYDKTNFSDIYWKKDSCQDYSAFHAVAELVKNKELAEFVIKELVNKGIDIDQQAKIRQPDKTYQYETPLIFAFNNSNYEIAKLLLKYGAKTHFECKKMRGDVSVRD